ncbi:MAG: TetR/AcrR family transcriptional regulator [Kutzneria sp.]|nr:TetR/AcrR family transcriptional regulator [Kutzneria sp.]MBV9845692.1 TetR/AcrR family transcriptional regulator [Kutzneria sp.]
MTYGTPTYRLDARPRGVATTTVAGVTATQDSHTTDPVAEVSAEFRRRLLDGMAAAIEERGFRDSTVADVVRHARTSRRTFYEHFANKQACLIVLLQEMSSRIAHQIEAAVDGHSPLETQARQAIEAWIAASESSRALTVSWIRDLPSLGSAGRQVQRGWLDMFSALVQRLANTPELLASGVSPPSRQTAIMLVGGLRELIAVTVEDGDAISGIIDVAVDCVLAVLGPRH